MVNIHSLSDKFSVRKLNMADVDIIFNLCSENTLFYQYNPPFVTRESIIDDMNALPPGKTYDDKYYTGFFHNGTLVAVMDLIAGYPSEKVALMGFFMMNKQYQNKGIGSDIIKGVCMHLKEMGFNKIRLGVDKGNPQSYAFWLKNNFSVVSQDKYIVMELSL